MKKYIKEDPWKIIEEGFHRKNNKISESLFSIGNGRMGQRANFEETFTGESLQGNYVAGVYYPDKTRVGWWKNGYPEYFAKVLNAPNWVGIDIEVDGEVFDLAKCEVRDFIRTLNMREGYLERSFTARLTSGRELKVKATRFCSLVDDEAAVIRYAITPLNFSGSILFTPYIDGDIKNEDANYDEKFWNRINEKIENDAGYLVVETKKTEFWVASGMKIKIEKEGEAVDFFSKSFKRDKYVACPVKVDCSDLEEIVLYKFAANLSSENHPKEAILDNCQQVVEAVYAKGYEQMKKEQAEAWAKVWANSDIEIDGDVAAQQGIRFNIFQLYQTYTGADARLNIGPKGFTGEKYGGSTYWDTEAYCLPFYMATADQTVGRNLLIYRYRHLEKAIENAAKLGFTDGAALYPMVTMNGEESHNEWEITFEEIHRNGAIAYAIYDYIRYTGDQDYLVEYGVEVLIAIARFWAQRVHWSARNQQYMIHGVTGPNEYENNVNNNWYTNYIASWCLQYTIAAIEYVKSVDPDAWKSLKERIKFYTKTETNFWTEIIDQLYLPYDEKLDIFVQHDTFLDKELQTVEDLKPEDRPLNQNWSWDRILRSVFIKQADVLQGLYFFEDKFDYDTHRRNFEFYEPRTVHESSLSPCVHAILAAKLDMQEKAYEMYLRTARLDLDDYNNDTEDGCHITSMAGTWLAVVKGFGGMRVYNDRLIFDPFIPTQWEAYRFNIRYRGHYIKVEVNKNGINITNESDQPLAIQLHNQEYEIPAGEQLSNSVT